MPGVPAHASGTPCAAYLEWGNNWMFQDAKLRPLWKDRKVPVHQRTALGMTYDRVFSLKNDYARAAADIPPAP